MTLPSPAPGARRNARYTPLDVDGPLPLDMIRAVPRIRRDPLGFLESVVARHGDLVAFPMPRAPVLLVNDPDGARRVLQDNPRGYSKRTVQYDSLAQVTGQGLLTADSPPWRQRRRVAQPAFHSAAIDAVVRHTVEAAERLREDLAPRPGGGPVDADAAVMRTMLDVVGRTLFATDLTTGGERLLGAVDEGLRAVVQRARSPMGAGPLRRWPVPSRRRLVRATAMLDEVASDVVRRRRAAGLADTDIDLLALLLRSAEQEGGLDDDEIRDELVTMVIAGHETVATCLTWALSLLAGDPVVQNRLRGELARVLAGRAPVRDDLPRLPFTRAVVDEALRLYPPAWMITRRALERDVVAGVDVPPGTLVLISPWLLHRRPGVWDDPARFDPDRFLGRHATSGPGAAADGYLPFGAGPRLCIGRDFALVEAVLVLATILRDRSVTPAGRRPVQVDALVTLRPRGGLPLVFRDLTDRPWPAGPAPADAGDRPPS